MTTILSWATSTQGVSSPVGVASDGTYLYVASSGGNGVINRILLSNPATYTATFINTSYGNNICYSICTDGTYLYTASKSVIGKWNKNTGTVVAASWATFSNPNLNIIANMETDGTYLYAFNGNAIMRFLLSNPANKHETWATGSYSSAMTLYGDSLYVGTITNTVLKIPLNNPSGATTAVNSITTNFGLVIDGVYIYSSVQHSNRIDRALLSTGNVSTPNWISGLNSCCDMVIAGGYMYIANFLASTISRVNLDTLTTSYSSIGATVQSAGSIPTFNTISSSLTSLTFTDMNSSSTIQFSANTTPSMVVLVGGGGGGGYAQGTFEGAGGGGGGGVIVLTATTFTAGQSYTITVGAGGSGGISASASATNGSNSVISGNFTITALGGGFGSSSTGNVRQPAGSGGSGGGSNAWYGAIGQQFAGGAGNTTNPYGAGATVYGNAGGATAWGGAGGGGGGATSVGGNNTTYPNQGGNGGVGGGAYTLTTNGTTIGNYGGGGGGGGVGSTYTVSLYGAGSGGGGTGGNYNTNATAGTANTGGGGGGGGGGNNTLASALNGASGGSGVVIFVFSNSSYPCFRIDTRILTNRGYRKVQHLRKGDLVKTFRNGFVPIHAIGTSEISHSANDEDVGQRRRGCWLSNRLFRLTTEKYPELTEDLILTGYHSVLVDEFHGIEKTETRGLLGDIYITDGFYRLPACIDRRASIYEESGRHRIYHLALENDNYYGNYGIYANGLLVESCCKRYLLELSNMKLLT